jgi:hypothetical protein
MKHFLPAFFLLLTLSSTGLTEGEKVNWKGPVTETQAVKLAEDFVSRNGYTADSADTSQYKLTYELMDGQFSTSELLRKRHNTLMSKAYGIRRSGDAWHIAFLYAGNVSKIDARTGLEKVSSLKGRAVIMDIYGKKIRMAHKEPVINSFKKL